MSTIITALNTNVGPKFMHIDNESLMSTARDLGLAMDPTSTARITGNERRAIGVISLHGMAFDLGGSLLTPRIMLRNDNTGRAALRVNVGLFRLICSNGLMASVPGMSFEKRISHIYSPNQIQKVLDIPMVAEELLRYVDSGALRDIVELAVDTPVQNAIDVVASLPIGERAKNDAIAVLAFGTNREQDDTRTAWGVYNVVNEAIRGRSRTEVLALTKDEGLLSHIMTLAA